MISQLSMGPLKKNGDSLLPNINASDNQYLWLKPGRLPAGTAHIALPSPQNVCSLGHARFPGGDLCRLLTWPCRHLRLAAGPAPVASLEWLQRQPRGVCCCYVELHQNKGRKSWVPGEKCQWRWTDCKLTLKGPTFTFAVLLHSHHNTDKALHCLWRRGCAREQEPASSSPILGPESRHPKVRDI